MSEVAGPFSVTRVRSPAWLWPHLCDFDAPGIAVLWQSLFCRTLHVKVGLSATAALALTVWLIYACDRLLDASRGVLRTARHCFHQEHREVFLSAIALVLVADLLLVRDLPNGIVRPGVLVAALVIVYLLVVHDRSEKSTSRFPKEGVVGVLFAAGTALAPIGFAARSGNAWMGVALLGALCTTNCVAIESWEWPACGAGAHWQSTSFAGWLSSRLPGIWWFLAAASLLLTLFYPASRGLSSATLLSALAFLGLHASRTHCSPELLRVLADVPLLSPLLFLAFK